MINWSVIVGALTGAVAAAIGAAAGVLAAWAFLCAGVVGSESTGVDPAATTPSGEHAEPSQAVTR